MSEQRRSCRWRIVACVPPLVAAIACVLPRAALRAAQPNEPEQQSVYLVNARNDSISVSGSGFVVAPGIVATNAHVTNGFDTFVVVPPLGRADQAVSATLLWQDPSGDLALLKVNGPTGSPLPLSLARIKKGMHVYALGYPGISNHMQAINGAIDSTQTEGSVQGVFNTLMDWSNPDLHVTGRQVTTIQHGAQIWPGNSGGPLFDDCGRVVGINSASPLMELAYGARMPAGNLAVSIGELVSAANSAGVSVSFRTASDECASTTASPTPSERPSSAAPSSAPRDGGKPQIAPIVRRGPLWMYIAGGMFLAALAGAALLAVRKWASWTSSTERARVPVAALVCGHIVVALPPTLTGRRHGMVVGRSDGFCDATIAGAEISRRQARFFLRDGLLHVEDLGSAHGTSLNGRRLKPFSPLPVPAEASVAFGPHAYQLGDIEEAAATAGRYQTYLIGRHADCDLEIRGDPTVSRHHAELTIAANGQALLTDRNSRTGTRVKRAGKWENISTMALTPDMRLKFGTTETTAERLINVARSQSTSTSATSGAVVIRRDPETGLVVGD
jgi:hypothetical protein